MIDIIYAILISVVTAIIVQIVMRSVFPVGAKVDGLDVYNNSRQ